MGDYDSTGGKSVELRITEADQLWNGLPDVVQNMVLLDSRNAAVLNFLHSLSQIIGEGEVDNYLRIKNEEPKFNRKRRNND